MLFHSGKAHATQTCALPFSGLDVLVAARTKDDRRRFRVIYPLAVFHKVFGHRSDGLVDEGQGLTAFTGPAGATDAVHVVFVGGRKIIIDDV